MILYTYEDVNSNVVDETYATTDLVRATDHAARWQRKLVENTYEFADSGVIEDFTPQDVSDGH